MNTYINTFASSRILLLSVVFAFIGMGGYQAQAQEFQCTNFPPRSMSCAGTNCFGTYSPALPSGGTMIRNDTIAIECCGHIVMAFNGGGACVSASLKSPSARSALDALALSGIRVMVKSCQGQFLAYRSSSAYESLTFDPVKQFEKLHFDFQPKG